jgi:hypothetical protein
MGIGVVETKMFPALGFLADHVGALGAAVFSDEAAKGALPRVAIRPCFGKSLKLCEYLRLHELLDLPLGDNSLARFALTTMCLFEHNPGATVLNDAVINLHGEILRHAINTEYVVLGAIADSKGIRKGGILQTNPAIIRRYR